MKTNRLYKRIRSILPIKQAVSYKGNYQSFWAAKKDVELKHGEGYAADSIFRKVSESTLKVLRGEAAFERDSFLFQEKQVNYNLMMYLYQAHARDGYLNVLDFGGALGSTYLQHREELEEIGAGWTVTEQEHFVRFGKENVASGKLEFAGNGELEAKWPSFNVLLLSSVLQYIENPEELIAGLCSRGIRNIIIERTPVSDHDRFWVETVHEPIYEAAYPCRVFEERGFVRLFESAGYILRDSYHSLVDGDIYTWNKVVEFKSFIFELKER